MKYADGTKQLKSMRKQITKLREDMRKVQAGIAPEPVAEYSFETAKGAVSLDGLFGDAKELIVIHNMGMGCNYCTLWADGYNGLYPHLANRAAFAVVTPDAPAKQAAFAKSRGWQFPMVSDSGSSFAADMGYTGEKGGRTPGISVFQKRGKSVVRVSDTGEGPYDDFCALWHLFDMLPEGAKGWQPRVSYA